MTGEFLPAGCISSFLLPYSQYAAIVPTHSHPSLWIYALVHQKKKKKSNTWGRQQHLLYITSAQPLELLALLWLQINCRASLENYLQPALRAFFFRILPTAQWSESNDGLLSDRRLTQLAKANWKVLLEEGELQKPLWERNFPIKGNATARRFCREIF